MGSVPKSSHSWVTNILVFITYFYLNRDFNFIDRDWNVLMNKFNETSLICDVTLLKRAF